MLEIEQHLMAIRDLADTCLRDHPSELNGEQRSIMQTSSINAQGLIELMPILDDLRRQQGHMTAVTSMSHEWRTPLTSILGYRRMVQTETFGPVAVVLGEKLDQIQAHAKAVWNWSTPNSFAQLP